MKYTLISDTHGSHGELELKGGDILIHCGDYTASDSYNEMYDFFEWLNSFKYDNVIFVPGNHDRVFETDMHVVNRLKLQYPKMTVLNHKYTVINGIQFFGTPIQPIFNNWAFNIEDKRREEKYKNIHSVDIFITHCPPYNKLCDGIGDKVLLDVINRVKPKLSIFGHKHKQGIMIENDTTYVNCSILDDNYDLVYAPVYLDINL